VSPPPSHWTVRIPREGGQFNMSARRSISSTGERASRKRVRYGSAARCQSRRRPESNLGRDQIQVSTVSISGCVRSAVLRDPTPRYKLAAGFGPNCRSACGIALRIEINQQASFAGIPPRQAARLIAVVSSRLRPLIGERFTRRGIYFFFPDHSGGPGRIENAAGFNDCSHGASGLSLKVCPDFRLVIKLDSI